MKAQSARPSPICSTTKPPAPLPQAPRSAPGPALFAVRPTIDPGLPVTDCGLPIAPPFIPAVAFPAHPGADTFIYLSLSASFTSAAYTRFSGQSPTLVFSTRCASILVATGKAPALRDRAGNANCEIQHTAAMVSTVEQQRPVVDPQALTTEDKPSASSSGWGQRQSRSGAELWFGAKLSFGLRLAGFARLAPVLQHGLIIHTGTAVRAMALTRPGTRTRSGSFTEWWKHGIE